MKLATLIPLLSSLMVGSVLAQAPSAKDRDPAVEKQLKELSEAIMDKKAARDGDATKIIDELLTKAQAPAPNEMSPKDKEAFVKGLDEIFTRAKPRELEKKVIYDTATLALQHLPGGSKVLQKAFHEERFSKKEWLDTRAKIINALGKTKDESMVEFLVKLVVRDTNDPILKAAGEALGNYDGAPGKVKKEIAEKMIKRLNSVSNQADASVDPNDAQAKASRDTRAVILDPWCETLGKLTRQQFRTAREWEHWYNKNKDSDWEKPAAKK